MTHTTSDLWTGHEVSISRRLPVPAETHAAHPTNAAAALKQLLMQVVVVFAATIPVDARSNVKTGARMASWNFIVGAKFVLL